MIELEFDDGTRYRIEGKLKAIHHLADEDARPQSPLAPRDVAPAAPAAPDYYTLAEVATRLGMSHDAAYALVKSKDLAGVQFNKHWKVSARELERFIARKEGRPTPSIFGIEEAHARRHPS